MPVIVSVVILIFNRRNQDAFRLTKRLSKNALSLSADSGVESLNKHKFALQNPAKNTAIDTQKAQADVPQYGRSMIEMLGVLAIIGVLSVGGIAGYSKAMTKFKVNKTVDLVAQISANIRTLYKSQHYYNLNQAIVKKAKLAPEEVFQADGSLNNPFGGKIYFNEEASWGGGTEFLIALSGIPEDACMELATLDWGTATSSGLVEVTLNSHDDTGDREVHAYAEDCDTQCLPVSVSTAATSCSGNNNLLQFEFK
jgi:type II secretory pathway pseudopilin PulG